MPIKPRMSKVRDHRITTEAIEAYRAGDGLALHRALGLRPWIVSPLEVTPDQPCPWPDWLGGATGWALALQLRSELERATTG